MSIATTVRTAGPFAGTGSLVALPFAFKVFTASDLVVQRTNVAGDVATLTLTTHYSVSLNADQDTSPGGTVTLVTALAVGETAALTSGVSATQPLQLASGGPFLPGQIEDALDRAMIVVQQQGVLGEQTLRVPLGETALILPSADQRANKALLFDADGDPYLAAPASGSAADVMLQYASTDAGKGAALVGLHDAATKFLATTVEAALAELTDPVIRVNSQTGADPTGVADSTAAIQAAIDAAAAMANGGRVIARGTYLVDTIKLKSNVTLDLTGSRLNFIAHTTSHNPVIRLGDGTTACNKAKVIGGKIDGNASAQTFAGEMWSHGIFIWGSDDNEIIGTEVFNCQGDNITIGYDTARVVGANRNKIVGCECYTPNALRMCIAITYGNENRILYNRCSGAIDLELNAAIGECKNNLVHGNSGRAQTESFTTARTSDLTISLASLNTDTYRYFGNTVTGNHCNFISMQFNKATTLSQNVIVGSVSTQARLVAIDGCDDTVFTDNQLDINFGVATSITDAIRTRGSRRLLVSGNNCRGDASTRPFHSFTLTYNAVDATDHIFTDNQTESGYYRNGGCLQPTERARFRIDNTNGGALSITQVSGVKCNASVSRSAATCILASVGNAGAQYQFEMLPHCNATTAAATSMTHMCAYTYTLSGSSRTITALTYAPAAGAVSLTAFSFASAGNTGTFFVDVLF